MDIQLARLLWSNSVLGRQRVTLGLMLVACVAQYTCMQSMCVACASVCEGVREGW